MSLRAPTGDLERWLVTDVPAKGVYRTVWHHYWFGARELAMRGRIGPEPLAVEWCPLSAVERASGVAKSTKELATERGLETYQEFPRCAMVTKVDHVAGIITAEPQTLPLETSQEGLRDLRADIQRSAHLKPTEVVHAHGGRESRSGSSLAEAHAPEAVTGRRDVPSISARPPTSSRTARLGRAVRAREGIEGSIRDGGRNGRER